MNTIFMIVL